MGCVVYEVLFGTRVFDSDANVIVYAESNRSKRTPVNMPTVYDEPVTPWGTLLSQLTLHILEINPRKRPAAADVLRNISGLPHFENISLTGA
jgi:hypothetical protein